jgi:hypothetical protein
MANNLEKIVEAWDRDDVNLMTEMDTFEDMWVHKNQCKRYIKTGYCIHLEKAQQRKFGNRVKIHLNTLSTSVS